MRRLGFFALLTLIVAGCATAYGPRYQAASGPGDIGYFDTRLDENRYRIQYRTDYADPALAQDFAMRRAAELTLNRGYDWFQVINRNNIMTDDAFGRYEGSRYRFDDGPYRDRPAYYDRGYGDDSVAVIDVVMGYNPPPRGSSIYEARRVLDYLNSRRYDDRYYDRRY